MEALRTCKDCGIEAYTFEELHLFKKDHNKLGRANLCKKCTTVRGQEWRSRTKPIRTDYIKVRERNSKMLKSYGITYNDYKDMYAEQNGECAICKSHYTLEGYKSEKLHVDHCHSTGKVRGLLCHKCNTALGLLKDNTQNLLNAIDYIKQ